MSGSRKVQELQGETNRLLSEYRIERERADRLDVQNRALSIRVADLEKRLAVIADASAGNGYEMRNPSSHPVQRRINPNLSAQPNSSWNATGRRY